MRNSTRLPMFWLGSQSYLQTGAFSVQRHCLNIMSRRRKKKNPLPNGMPLGAIAADRSKQVPNGLYDPPPLWYVDKDFVCVDCGSEETWTAEQQKWYYEEATGTLYASAIRCHDYRMKIRKAKSLQREQMMASKKAEVRSTRH